MENKLERKYGLFMAVCMVLGIVIGSGVFFKAQDILSYTGGNVLLGVLAWIIGGIIMIICSLVFANFATKYEKINGVVDYAEAIMGKKYAYIVGWFMATIYYPAMTGVLAWVSARYTLVLFGSSDITGGLCLALAAFYLVAIYALNNLSPKLSGKFHVSATVIKMIPLGVMIVFGLIIGLINGNTVEAFKTSISDMSNTGSIFRAIVAAAFAYEGWIIATSINSEIKNSKKNLPLALVIGSMIIMFVYVVYFIALTGGASSDSLITEGSTKAFVNLFGNAGAVLLNAFVVISCLGTLNGLMIACSRGMYSIALRSKSAKNEVLTQVDPLTNMPTNSGIVGLLFASFWLFYFYGANLQPKPIFGLFSFDSSELPIVTVYLLYVPMFIKYIIRERKGETKKNLILTGLACAASLFMVVCAVYAHGIVPFKNAQASGNFQFPILFYLIMFIVIMSGSLFFNKDLLKKENK